MAQRIPWAFDPEKAVLLVVDMQNDFVREGAVKEVPMARKFLPNMKRIIDASRQTGIPVLYTAHVHYNDFNVTPLEVAYDPNLEREGMRKGTLGVEIVDELAPLSEETVVQKHRYDAFYNTQLETIIRNIRGLGVADTVIITGTVTNICCESTARSAFMRDFKVVFVSDANGGLDETSQRATLTIMEKAFARVMSTDEVVGEIEGKGD